MKFFKEIIASFKEGVAEAREEMANEAKGEQPLDNIGKEEIEKINYQESFATALGAPFRIIVFGDWFSLFDKTKDENTYPIHLYQFGDYPKLDKHKNDFKTILKRDFGITNKQTTLEVLSNLFKIGSIKKDNTILINTEITTNSNDYKIWNMNKEGSKALLISVLSHITSAATDLNYLEKSDALHIMKNISFYAKENYDSWQTYTDDFSKGEKNIGLNNSLGKSYLKKYIGYLNDKKGSPWNNISWKQ